MVAAQRRLTRVLADLQRAHGERGTWAKVPEPTVIRDRDKLLRGVKYVPINPVREGLVDDPLRWMFSTAREVGGAVADPWVDRDELARALGVLPRNLPAWLHKYVSSDPSCSPNGTPLPRPAERTSVAKRPLGDVIAASAACHLATPRAIRERGVVRDTFIALATEHGWSDPAVLAEQCGVSVRAVQKSMVQGLVVPEAATLCLGDDRLLTSWPPPRAGLALRNTGSRNGARGR